MNALEAVKAWRDFVDATRFAYAGSERTWRSHIASATGYVDEVSLVQPTVFPKFAAEFLGFIVNDNLAPERTGAEGRPDFTPADTVTHPFVFETKSTSEGNALASASAQIRRYLVDGRPRIKQVVLTNLVGIRLLELGAGDTVTEVARIDLRGLLHGAAETAATTGDALRFVEFLEVFHHQALTPTQKIARVRTATSWNPLLEVTDAEWIVSRVDRVVQLLEHDAAQQIAADVLTDPSRVDPAESGRIIAELRRLEARLGTDNDELAKRTLSEYAKAAESTAPGRAMRQYRSYLAYFLANRLLLVRVWEDLDLLPGVLYDGGLDHWMGQFEDTVSRVVALSFTGAQKRYKSLFAQTNAYTWFVPGEDAYANVIYELANTYFGAIESDVLGNVYERLLERVDRKLLGQYYTPRDIIRLIWDLIDLDPLAAAAENDDRSLRVLDIATGSGGFLVDCVARLRKRVMAQRSAGAAIELQEWVNGISDGITGVEYQLFPSYLAELNLLIQLAQVLAEDQTLRLPPMGIITTDTLRLHNPVELDLGEDPKDDNDLLLGTDDRVARARLIRDAIAEGYELDVACGNPPYVGQKVAAGLLAKTKEDYPYWDDFTGHHMDYLYWFLILGVSKLREGGRFGFITTEYWLRAIGARPLRKYLASRSRIERIILFRKLRLFPDAPGQHSMIIIGERTVPPDGLFDPSKDEPGKHRPQISVYDGDSVLVPDRGPIIDAIRDGRTAAKVRTFQSSLSPNNLKEDSWSEVVLTKDQASRRATLRKGAEMIDFDPVEGVLTAANRMRANYATELTAKTLNEIGWPERKAGIFILTPEEVALLGALNAAERKLVRPYVNTEHVLPYAAVFPQSPDSILYMAASEVGSGSGSGAFPAGLPHLEAHLLRFQSLLQAKVDSYEDSRPWWSLHRPRTEVVSRDKGGNWADYCLVPNWGQGGRLIVGLAPSGSVPAQGLHALLAPENVPAAYVSGLFNSTVVQDLAETLPPGYLRAEDLRELGIPLIPEERDHVVSEALKLAGLVKNLVTLSARFPIILETLRADISLTTAPLDSWLPARGPQASWGPLADLSWVKEVTRHGPPSESFRDTVVERDLFGLSVVATGRGNNRVTVRLVDDDDALAEALARYFRGSGATGRKFRDVADLSAPIDRKHLVSQLTADEDAISKVIDDYRSCRDSIDSAVGDAL